jgi:1,2-diacylglycerol 3-alpha-glucosyltransferase
VSVHVSQKPSALGNEGPSFARNGMPNHNKRDWKIAIASSGLGHVSRGIEAWASDVAAALARRGVRVTLFKGGGTADHSYERVLPCLQRRSHATARLLRFLPRRLFWRLGLADGYSVEQVTFAVMLLRHLRKQHFDLLHVQDFLLARLIQKARALGLVPTRTIVGHGTNESHDFLGKMAYLQHLAPYYLAEARAAGCWKPTWTAIPNFVDTDRFYPGRNDALRHELGIPQEACVVLSAAAISRTHKRIDYLINECHQVLQSAPELPCWLVVAGGKEADTEELIRVGRDLLGERVRFLVQFPRERMPDLYRACDAFALCSLREMMPIALLEATASGLPCLVHDHPIMRWITEPGSLVLNLQQSGALAGAIRQLSTDGRTRRSLGKKARQHCLENFSRERVVDQLLAYYRLVLGTDRPTPCTEHVLST